MMTTDDMRVIDEVNRLVRKATALVKNLTPRRIDDGMKGSLIMNVAALIYHAGIDAERYKKLAPKPMTTDDPLFRELSWALGERKPKRRARP